MLIAGHFSQFTGVKLARNFSEYTGVKLAGHFSQFTGVYCQSQVPHVVLRLKIEQFLLDIMVSSDYR